MPEMEHILLVETIRTIAVEIDGQPTEQPLTVQLRRSFTQRVIEKSFTQQIIAPRIQGLI
jgi:hypothetical protein